MSALTFERSTRAVRFDQLSMAMTETLAQYCEESQLVLTDDMPAWLTSNVNQPSQSIWGKLFGRRVNRADKDSAHEVLVVLHTTHVLLVTSRRKRGTSVLSVPLSQASVRVGGALEDSFSVVEDSGITLGGFPDEHGHAGTTYIGLGPEPAGAECAESIRAAVTDAKNP